MKLSALKIAAFVVLGLSMSPVTQAEVKKVKPVQSPHQMAKVDVANSKLTWIGKKVTGQHNGSLLLKDGELHLAKNEIVGGTFNVDMTSLTVEDLKDEKSNQNLVGHLKSDDFFSAATNPIATFKIVSVKPITLEGATHEVQGTLTIKGITHPLSFPATITVNQGLVSAQAKEIKVDRTLYNIRYGSGKFFQNLGDKTINDHFTVDLTLVAK
ncbi:MAG: hypothetical protein KCHDKBKB_01787 [Elusimicrobia bacterium]|nr:hypothetical protein [Elusimicrobiota bacterium]